jgi:predicted phage tail protein
MPGGTVLPRYATEFLQLFGFIVNALPPTIGADQAGLFRSYRGAALIWPAFWQIFWTMQGLTSYA